MSTTATNKSESIFTILENNQTSTMVKDYGYYNMVLPATMPTAAIFEDELKLQTWAEESGVIHAVLQKGIQKHLIDLRAKFRQVKKDETWNLTTAQSNVDDMEWQVVTRPNQNSTAAIKAQVIHETGIKMATAMKAVGVDENIILSTLTPVCGAEVAKAIIDSLI